eukprot:8797614-Pyramimonas_sp.AAC.1
MGRNVCRSRNGLQVKCLDAAQPFDYEARAKAQLKKQEKELNNQKKLNIASNLCKEADSSTCAGIVGFGNFGQFIATRFIKQGHKVLAFSRSDYTKEAKEIGAEYFDQIDDFCEEHPDVVILCTRCDSHVNNSHTMSIIHPC